MNILEPMYEACLMRMRGFVEDEDRKKKKIFSNKYKYFRDILQNIQNEQHPNQQYFIYKNIILRNLYGVDIMKEAVEIAKLRLFLKLVATVEADYRKPNLGLEPLPDVDFNIRAGNTLVGFATEDELKEELAATIDGVLAQPVIEEKCEIVARAFARYKDIQLGRGDDFREFKVAKDELLKRLKELNYELSILLHKQSEAIPFGTWLLTHQPFHWFAEFYEIVQGNGGFDVVIGNPPYVEYKDVNYKLTNFKTLSCGNLYAFVMERILRLQNKLGISGMIVPISGHSTDRMSDLVKHYYYNLKGSYIFNISADANPSKLFEGVKFRLAIFLTSNQFSRNFSTKYKRWYSNEREYLFEYLIFNEIKDIKYKAIIPKISDPLHLSILRKIFKKNIKFFFDVGNKITYYHNAPVNWVRAHEFVSYFSSERDGDKSSTQLKFLKFDNETESKVASSIICSSTFFLWWITFSDCYHLNKPEIANFNFDKSDVKCTSQLNLLYDLLKKDLLFNSVRRVYNYRTSGRVEYDELILPQFG